MERRNFISRLGTGFVGGGIVVPILTGSSCQSAQSAEECSLKRGQIQHMVIFDLQHEKDPPQATAFLEDGRRILSAIPVVQNFQVFKQVSIKNDYDYGFSMIFGNKEDYSAYNNHPDHVSFVENRWKKEVSRFLEIDFEI